MRLLKYFLVCVLMAGLAGCSDDLSVKPGFNDFPEGYIQLNLAVPDPVKVSTRSVDESAIDNLEVFIFNEDGTGFFQHQSVSADGIIDNTVGLSLGSQARNNTVLIYAVANVNPEKIKDITTVEGLRKYVLDQYDLGDYLPMIGFGVVDTSRTNTPTLSLYRAVAKVTAGCAPGKGELKGIQLYGNSVKGYLGSPKNTEEDYQDYIFHNTVSTKAPSTQDFEETALLYTYPSKGVSQEDMNSGAYSIVKVARNGSDQYYRLNLRTEKEGTLTYIDLLANHHYQIEITGFMTDGYASAEEAAKHPESDQYVVYTIHDHASEILSMVTDGVNELGVSPEVVIRQGDDGRSGTLIVKCYAPGQTVGADEIKFDYDNTWLTISPAKEHIDVVADPNPSFDSDNHGQQYEYEISIRDGKNVYEDQTWDVTVIWENKALKRTVSVIYESAFLLPEICTVELLIKDNTGAQFSLIKDYLTFVSGQGTSTEKNGTGTSIADASSTPKLYGIRPEDMTGAKRRNSGFHFPMPYGEKDGQTSPWTYEYTVNFASLTDRDDTGSRIKDINVRIEAESRATSGPRLEAKNWLQQNVAWSYTPGSSEVKLTFTGDKTQYDYAAANIVFTVTYEDYSTTTEIMTGLYHTGFFHYVEDTKYVEKKGYYYYEVVPMGKTGEYWLDRNIGATSNKDLIDISDDDNIDRSSAGLHYTIINATKAYELPEFDFGMCPPGYHVPNQTEWDNLRLSTNFTTQSVIYDNTVYMSTYYVSTNSQVGNIFLQKSRFVNGQDIYKQTPRYTTKWNNGDTGAGYYWSVTEAPAMEKEQMGNWLRALYLNGSASSYSNASVTDHRMPVRCKAGTSKEALVSQEYYISFNVHEVTHVYLFDTRNGSNTGLYNFPGKAVGTQASAIKWQHFSCSTTVDPEYLRMLFVRLEDDGKVTIYTRNGDKFDKNYSYSDDFLSADKSWSVTKGVYYDFCAKVDDRDKNVLPSKPGDCITSDGNTGGGGDGDGGNNDKGGNETERGSDTNPYDIIIWSGNKVVTWSEQTHVDYAWKTVPVNSRLRIYGESISSDEPSVCIRRQNWKGNLLGQSDGYFQYNNVNGYVEILLTQDLIDELITYGLALVGKNFRVYYVTLVLEGELKELPSGDYTWTGNMPASDYNGFFNNLKTTEYDWNKINGGTLSIYYNEDSNMQLLLKYANGETITTYASWNNNVTNPIVVNLTSDFINNIRAKGGLMFGGQFYTLTKVEIKVSN